ncbi:carbohydrate-binding protein [Blautia schinkii]|nr:carbohydrate-binding protein [Blautia schinkii]
MEICLKVFDENEKTVEVSHGEDEVSLMCTREYREGDGFSIETSEKNVYVWLQWDDALGKSLVYLTGNVTYRIPFGEKRINLSPKAFSGNKHLLYARLARDYEIKAYRNLALNVNDQHLESVNCYPHASANVETRGESVFAAQNAIDGVVINSSHGEWPYQSWGINRQADAAMRIDFGRTVEADRIVLYTRADFPHDSWWTEVTFTFSDGSTLIFSMEKSELPHELTFEKKQITWVQISDMKKAPDISPFPALSQMEVYGTDL